MAFWEPLPMAEKAIGGFKGLYELLDAAHRPLGALSAVSNLLPLPGGALKTRPGYTAVGSAISAAVTRGMHQYENLAGTTVQLLAQAGAQLSYWNDPNWTSISAAMPAKKFQGANLNDLACLFWSGSAPQKWDGSTLSALGGTPPQGEFVTAAYEQLFLTGIPTREGDIDFCDVSDPETWTAAATNDAGSITVSASPLTWVDFAKDQGQVVIWSRYELFVLHGPETPNRPDLWSVETVAPHGTPNGRTVQRVGNSWIWLTDSEKVGFARWSGGRPVIDRDPIQTSLDLIDWSNIANACSWTDLEGRYYCSVPKTSGVIWFIYDPRFGWFTGSGYDVRASAVARFSGQEIPVIGNEVGAVYKTSGTDDAGTAISWSVEVGPSPLDNAFYKQHLVELRLILSLASGASATGYLSTAESGDYGTGRSITANSTLTQFTVPLPISVGEALRANIFRLKVSGSGVTTLHDGLFRFMKERN